MEMKYTQPEKGRVQEQYLGDVSKGLLGLQMGIELAIDLFGFLS
jgi:hypothetical protein